MNMLTGESQIISRAMMAQQPLETPNAIWWDGFFAFCEGQPLAAMPTEQHEFGWWSANLSEARVADLREAREDEEWIRRGC